MTLTKKQEEGLKIAVARYKAREPYTCISGYAGAGKSTLVKFIIAALNLDMADVAYVAYTGKAAKVLAQKGCPNATTAHKLLYFASPTPSGKYIFKPKSTYQMGYYKLIIVDEVSMLPSQLWTLLLTHRIHVIALGDPGQLPPVSKEDDNHVLDKPHVFLDEIMRQAQDSEIIRLSMHVREGHPLGSFQSAGQQVQIYTPREVVTGMYDWADQILCATNRTRTNINNEMRARKGFDPNLPNPSDKVISLRNHWECYSDKLSALTNGTIGNITQFTKETIRFPYKYHLPPTEVLNTTIHTEDGEEFENLQIDYKHLITGEPTFDSKQLYKLLKDKAEPPYEFAYAYAITTHKAQGSEWDKIMLIEESFPFSPEEHRRWLYTGITRAKEKLVLIKK